jgi:Ca2+-binding RTX toxin-like protein
VAEGTDLIVENAGEGHDQVIVAWADHRLADNAEDLTLLADAASRGYRLTGNALANRINGAASDDTLDGAAGADTLTGGAGNDTYVVDSSADVIVENAGEGTDSVRSNVNHTLAAHVENLTLTGSTAMYATGNAQDNTLQGNAGRNVLDGAAGSDTVVLSGVMADYTFMRARGYIYVGDRIANRDGLDLWKNVERVTFAGSGQTLDIAALNIPSALDYIASYPDLMNAFGLNEAAGGDHYWNWGYGEGRTVSFDPMKYLASNADLMSYYGADAASARWHYFAYGRNEGRVYDATLVNQLGSAAADTLTGTAGNDGLFGLEGNDTLRGGDGSDGLSGGAGADWLAGGAGADRLGGGAGDDTYVVDNALDYVAEAAGQGRDTVRASVSYALGQNLTGLYKQLYDNVEDLVLTGSADIDGTGNALDNRLQGNAGRNVLDGAAGSDTVVLSGVLSEYTFMRVGSGAAAVIYVGDRIAHRDGLDRWKNIEKVSFLGSGQTVDIASLAIPSALDYVASYADLMNARTQLPGQFLLSATYGTEQAAADHYWNTGYAQGRSVSFDPLKYLASNVDLLADLGADAATATAHYMASGRFANRPYDATLASRLGTAGADSLAGSSGNDGLFGLEGADTLLGGAGADGLSGGAGADWLDGGAGADRMAGGAGDDTYIVDSVLDSVAEAYGAGIDTVRSSVSYALGQNLASAGVPYPLNYDNVEHLVLTGSADIDGTGNALANTLTGNAGANVLQGKLGNDTLMGGAGSDTYRFNRGDGQDLIVDSESFSNSVDVLQFGAGINANQLWLRKVALSAMPDTWELEIQVMGTNDKVRIGGWNLGPAATGAEEPRLRMAGGQPAPAFGVIDPRANRIEQIRSADGRTLLDTQVAQLVDAMASMPPPSGATSWSQLSASQQAQLNALGAWG